MGNWRNGVRRAVYDVVGDVVVVESPDGGSGGVRAGGWEDARSTTNRFWWLRMTPVESCSWSELKIIGCQRPDDDITDVFVLLR
jgi:hypothetical protein